MAAALVPIGSAILSSIIPGVAPAVEDLVLKLIDKIFGNGTGVVKKPVAEQIFSAIGKGMVDAGTATASQIPATADLAPKIDAKVAVLNAQGSLKGHDTVIGASTQPTIDPQSLADVQSVLGGGLNMLRRLLG